MKDRFRLEPVLKKGLPVKITCDGPGRVAAMLEIHSRKQRNDWLDMHSGGVPGVERKPPYITSLDPGKIVTLVR